MSRLLRPLVAAPDQPPVTSVILLVVRVSLASFMIVHGLQKLDPGGFTVRSGFVETVANLGFPLPTFSAYMAVLSEIVFAALVGLGLLTRPAAVAVIFTMGVAAFGQHGGDPFIAKPGSPSKEMAMLYLLSYLLILAVGPGRFALDKLLARRLKATPKKAA